MKQVDQITDEMGMPGGLFMMATQLDDASGLEPIAGCKMCRKTMCLGL